MVREEEKNHEICKNHARKLFDRFKNFRVTNQEEYVVCNWTCLIGELGGNLGFFLGGSILMYYDLLTSKLY